MPKAVALLIAAAAVLSGCSNPKPDTAAAARRRPALDPAGDARHDARRRDRARMRTGIETPAFNALAARGRRFRQAYATVPETLPSHMLDDDRPVSRRPWRARERPLSRRPLSRCSPSDCGRPAIAPLAFVSSFVLSRRFGIARGFDALRRRAAGRGASERDAPRHDRSRARLLSRRRIRPQPLFLWVHYFDPHAPYAPPEPFREPLCDTAVPGRSRRDGRAARAGGRRRSSRGGRAGCDRRRRRSRRGPRRSWRDRSTATCSISRRCTCRWWCRGQAWRGGPSRRRSARGASSTRCSTGPGIDASLSLRGAEQEIVLGEAMKPFLEYGWQPQTMAVAAPFKGDSGGNARGLRPRQRSGGVAGTSAPAPTCRPACARRSTTTRFHRQRRRARRTNLDEDARRRLASLGYVGATAPPVVRRDAPRPADMTRLFDVIDKASALFVQEKYAAAIPLFERILAADPNNLDATSAPGDRALAARARASRRSTRSGGRRGSRPSRRTCAPTSGCTMRADGLAERGGAAARTGRRRVARAAGRDRGAGDGSRARRESRRRGCALGQKARALRPFTAPS